ncbi:MAG: peroxiredoxin [Synechococcus sp. TMED19]|mgnify:CR=1 FL=1|nr:MAG: peroxiredoxin [Synechococcus sp. TMED19]
MALTCGDQAPDFTLKDHNGVERSLNDIKGKPLVLFFYPKDDTPGCTIEACGFRDSYDEFQALGAEVWGVSGDGASSHRRFIDRHQLPYPLLVDDNNKLREAFGVARSLFVVPGRVTYVIDAEGVVRLVFNALLDATAHVAQAKAALQQLAG